MVFNLWFQSEITWEAVEIIIILARYILPMYIHKLVPGPFTDWRAALVIAKISPPVVILDHVYTNGKCVPGTCKG